MSRFQTSGHILTAIDHMLKHGVDYRDLGADHFSRTDKTRSVNRLLRKRTAGNRSPNVPRGRDVVRAHPSSGGRRSVCVSSGGIMQKVVSSWTAADL